MTPELFDILIIGTILVGGALAVVRFYQDVSRPLPEEIDAKMDTQPHQSITMENDPTDPNQNDDQSTGE